MGAGVKVGAGVAVGMGVSVGGGVFVAVGIVVGVSVGMEVEAPCTAVWFVGWLSKPILRKSRAITEKQVITLCL